MGSGGYHGFGLRAGHYAALLSGGAGVPWIEVLTENVIGRGGRPSAVLERVRQDSSLCLHGVSLSIGGIDPLDEAFIGRLRSLAAALDAAVVSDHLCFGKVDGHYGHDLWPMPLTEEALAHVARRIEHVQTLLRGRFAIENVSSYARFQADEMSEGEFLAELCQRTGCGLLLDVNNVVVSAHNHGFSPFALVDALRPHHVVQYHLAGHQNMGTYLLDSHEGSVADEVLALFAHCLRRFGPRPTIVEWDGAVPPLEVVRAESERAAAVIHAQLAERAA
ncbi:MAG: DUF692 domain-containing protein [Myxococcota bacterium]